MISKEGSVRVDLVGGTLDLSPINVILPNVVTLNVATSLKAKVNVRKTDKAGVSIISKDYNSEVFFSKEDMENQDKDFFEHFCLVALILKYFKVYSNAEIELQSGSPPGAGLGGSSSMGVTLFLALNEFCGKNFSKMKAFKVVNSIEAKILNSGPAGYQDYFPALHGGILALTQTVGEVEVEQLYSDELKSTLEKRITLVYSGDTRLSGINNWEVYKAFFDKDKVVTSGLTDLAKVSFDTYNAIKSKDYNQVLDLIMKDGKIRNGLFSGILTDKMRKVVKAIENSGTSVGIKICGAGGGGCFLLVHEEEDREKVLEIVKSHNMKDLDFSIEEPILN